MKMYSKIFVFSVLHLIQFKELFDIQNCFMMGIRLFFTVINIVNKFISNIYKTRSII